MFCGSGFWIATDIGSRLASIGCRPLAALDGCRRMTSSTESLPSVLQKADSSWSGNWGRLVPPRNTSSASTSPLAQLSPPRARLGAGWRYWARRPSSLRTAGWVLEPNPLIRRVAPRVLPAQPARFSAAPREGAGCDFYESPAGEKELAAQ